MAEYYVSSVAGNDTTGTSWANAKTSILTAVALATASGDLVFVDSAHVEPTAAATWELAIATAGTYVAIVSVNRNGSTTTGHAGFQQMTNVITTNNAVGITILNAATAGHFYINGLYFQPNSGTNNLNSIQTCGTAGNVNRSVELVNCILSTPGTATTNLIIFGCTASATGVRPAIQLRDCTLKVRNSAGTTAPAINFRTCKFSAKNLTIDVHATQPTKLFGFTTSCTPDVEITASDLSAYNVASGVYLDATSLTAGDVTVKDTKIHGTPTWISGTWPNNTPGITRINVDSADTKTVFEFTNRLGTLLSTESIYRNSGFTVGSVNVGWQIVTTADCNEAEPFITPWMTGGWKSGTSATNADIKVIHDSATNLHNRNLWSEVGYVSDASFPKGTLASTRHAEPFDGSAVDWTADSDAWTGTGGFSNANKQRVRATFTPAEGSAIEGRLFVGVASKTLYLDPQLVMS